MVVYAALVDAYEMSRFFWEGSRTPIATALICYKVNHNGASPVCVRLLVGLSPVYEISKITLFLNRIIYLKGWGSRVLCARSLKLNHRLQDSWFISTICAPEIVNLKYLYLYPRSSSSWIRWKVDGLVLTRK